MSIDNIRPLLIDKEDELKKKFKQWFVSELLEGYLSKFLYLFSNWNDLDEKKLDEVVNQLFEKVIKADILNKKVISFEKNTLSWNDTYQTILSILESLPENSVSEPVRDKIKSELLLILKLDD